jgi:hypothetical protein
MILNEPNEPNISLDYILNLSVIAQVEVYPDLIEKIEERGLNIDKRKQVLYDLLMHLIEDRSYYDMLNYIREENGLLPTGMQIPEIFEVFVDTFGFSDMMRSIFNSKLNHAKFYPKFDQYSAKNCLKLWFPLGIVTEMFPEFIAEKVDQYNQKRGAEVFTQTEESAEKVKERLANLRKNKIVILH